VLTVVVLAAVIGLNLTANTVGLQFAGDTDAAASAWPQVSQTRFRIAIALDYLLIGLYVLLLWRFTRVAKDAYYVTPTAKRIGTSIAGLVFLVGALDATENLLLLLAPWPLPSGVPKGREWIWPMIEASALVKWLGLSIALLYLVPPLAWHVWRRVPGLRRGAHIQGLKQARSSSTLGDSG